MYNMYVYKTEWQRDYADIKKKRSAEKVEETCKSHTDLYEREKKYEETEMYQKYTRLRVNRILTQVDTIIVHTNTGNKKKWKREDIDRMNPKLISREVFVFLLCLTVIVIDFTCPWWWFEFLNHFPYDRYKKKEERISMRTIDIYSIHEY